jgi:hypothetical protein
MKHFHKLASILATGGLLVACATPPNSEKTPVKPDVSPSVTNEVKIQPSSPAKSTVPVTPIEVVPAEPPSSEKSLVVALTSYERGEYAKAMRQLSPLTTDTGLGFSARLQAMKTLAFSQCLIGAVIACRGTFERAFKLDSKFDLAPAEQGHPVWGPQFELARKNVKIN